MDIDANYAVSLCLDLRSIDSVVGMFLLPVTGKNASLCSQFAESYFQNLIYAGNNLLSNEYILEHPETLQDLSHYPALKNGINLFTNFFDFVNNSLDHKFGPLVLSPHQTNYFSAVSKMSSD